MAFRCKSTLAPLALGAAIGLFGCGEPPGAEPSESPGAAGGASGASSTLETDLMSAERAPGIGAETALPSVAENNASPAPKVIYLVYADGKTPLPSMNYNACSGLAPKFTCTFAPTLLECQQQIQAYLDRWYADFNVIFTLTKPTSGTYYTEVVSSGGGAWCKVDNTVAGVAPFLCKDLKGGVAYTLEGGQSAHDTAVIIAQEQAHLLGLEHVSSDSDIMYPYICRTCDGFQNKSLAVTGDRCDRQAQNSYQMMKDALGAWPGGPKPSAFGCMEDKQAPSLSFVTPHNGASMGHDFTVKLNAQDDCGLTNVTLTVSPQGLTATAKNGPFEWDLTGISGKQTITATAVDGSGHKTVVTLDVTAPSDGEVLEAAPTMGGAAGCTVATGAFGAAGLVPGLAMLLVFAGRGRRSGTPRRRWVTGALAVRRDP
ncbi:MAG TPA: Ig-like domain-containing protein [Polyangia bacterium]|nr:Ig-like domain-containing protein [Polyangia bacterium]